jgi:hypothetical protein
MHPEATDAVYLQDLGARIVELDEALSRHRASLNKTDADIARVGRTKSDLDEQLTEELRQYDSALLSFIRRAEASAARATERLHSLTFILRFPQRLSEIRQKLDSLRTAEQDLIRQLAAEQAKVSSAQKNISLLEEYFLEALLRVETPGVTGGDKVYIDRHTWIPRIQVGGNPERTWSFNSAGSGGKKTLFNVCFALALHRLASEQQLPLPSFLIIDSPMKNIGDDVNKEIFESFYDYLYGLARGPLNEAQFVIIDNEFVPRDPAGDDLSITERYMTPGDEDHPPLISYYRGA